MRITREQLVESRYRPNGVYGYKKAFCDLHACCENCDKYVRILCKVICKLEEMQTNRILKICKPEKES